MKKPPSTLGAVVVLGLCSLLMSDLARAAEDPATQRQHELNRLLRQRQLDRVEREQRINQLRYQQQLNQVQQQVKQVR